MQAVVAHLREERLLVAQRVGGDDLRRRVGNLDRDHARIRHDVREFREPETILGTACQLDYPLAVLFAPSQRSRRAEPFGTGRNK